METKPGLKGPGFFLDQARAVLFIEFNRMKSYKSILFMALILWTLIMAYPIQGEIRLASGVSEITPPTGLTNWITNLPYQDVLDPIFIRTTYMTDETTETVIVSWDMLDTFENAVVHIRSEVEKATGIPGNHVLLNASHTHSAPWSPRLGARFLSSMRGGVAVVEDSPIYKSWFQSVIKTVVESVKDCQSRAETVRFSVARCDVGDWLFNRRPLKPSGNVETVFEPRTPHVLPDGLKFTRKDPTALILLAESKTGGILSTLVNIACHPVSIYPYHNGISGDWPGSVLSLLSEKLQAPVQFLQGCAGNVVPVRRGLDAREEMASLIAQRCESALKSSHLLRAVRIRVDRTQVALPLTDAATEDWEVDFVMGEIMAVSLGDIAIVTLPGEPLIELAFDIQEKSPFPHTMVLGYSNGHGVHYVGRTGEKALGGYEMGPAGAGTDACGDRLTQAAIGLLKKLSSPE